LRRRAAALPLAAVLAAPLVVLLAAPVTVLAQAYPSKPVKVIVPLAAGGTGEPSRVVRADGEAPRPAVRDREPAQLGVSAPSRSQSRAAPHASLRARRS
jgi:hypothetical protein